MVQTNYAYARQWETSVNEEQSVRKVKKTYTRINIKRKFAVKVAALLFIYGLILVFLCIKSATLGYQIIGLEQDIKSYENANSRLQFGIQESCSLDKIEQIAINELGMNKPNKQIAVTLSKPGTEALVANQVNSLEGKNVAKNEEKPLYKLYSNVLILAEKN